MVHRESVIYSNFELNDLVDHMVAEQDPDQVWDQDPE